MDRIPKLLPVKYARMAASPFAFYRGAVAIMAADLASQPRTPVRVQLCGDAHVQNMGSFESPDGRILFDINDFDETTVGPWEWDVKRMATSIVLAGQESNHARPDCEKAVRRFLSRYCALVQEMAAQPVLTAARYQVNIAGRAASAALKQAERASPLDLLAKYTETSAAAGTGAAAGRPESNFRFKHVQHTLWPVRSRQAVLDSLAAYRASLPAVSAHLFGFYKPHDVAFKIVGTGSVALRDYIVLMEGNGRHDPLFLQIKQETRSVYAPHVEAAAFANQGERVVDGQRRIQPLSDPFLGWTRIGAHDFLVRQLNDHKGSLDIANLKGGGLINLADIAGSLLARGHIRSADPVVLKGYIGKPGRVIEALSKYATDYAGQVHHDFEQFHKAIKSRRIRAAQ